MPGLVAQLVRATDSSSGGPWFKPRLVHKKRMKHLREYVGAFSFLYGKNINFVGNETISNPIR